MAHAATDTVPTYANGARQRYAHASVIADQTLYVFGGQHSDTDFASPCMSLDLSTKLSTSSATWTHSCSRNGPHITAHTATINPTINMVVLFGGRELNDVESSVHLFSAEIGFWNTPTDTGFPLALVEHAAGLDMVTGDVVVYGGMLRDDGSVSNSTLRMVSDPSRHSLSGAGGGFSVVTPTSKSTVASASNDKDKDDDKDKDKDGKDGSASVSMLNRRTKISGDGTELLMTWANNTLPAGVTARVGHTLTAVNGTKMVVLGGASGDKLADMKTLLVYDAPQQSWTQRTATGKVPQARRNHVATVVNDTMIVVHGGTDANSTALGDVAVLNTDTWTWSRPNVTGAPAARYAHAAAQAGPYMILTFGRATIGNDSDYGIYILDTTVWRFVDQYEPGRAKLTVLFKSQHVTGGTIFGLLVASAVGLLVLLIMLYIGCTHYYNKHPRLGKDEADNMLPVADLRSFGRKLTVRLTSRRRRSKKEDAPEQLLRPMGPPSLKLSPTISSGIDVSSGLNVGYGPNASSGLDVSSGLNVSSGPYASHKPSASHKPYASHKPNYSPSIGTSAQTPIIDDASSVQLAFDISRDSSMDLDFMSYGQPEKPSTSRLSRRTHLDDIELPAGLRNRDPSPLRNTPIDAHEPSSWSRPTTSHSDVRQKSTHISDVLPRIIGSRLTLLPEPAAAAARYRFDELNDVPPMPADGHEMMPIVDRSQALRRPSAPFAQPPQPLRDSIDINTVWSQNQRFYIVNPDD
ncbi:hypothetical protein IW147_001935 [Coemansia sp. RSA 720]|nr:hypothetical protein IW147_001935 [Coemansia sp. RSA 720]